MDRSRSRSTRSSKTCWRAAKGALSSSGANAAVGTVLDDADASACEGGGVGVPPGNDNAEVAEVWCNPASLSVRAGVIVPESVWEWFNFSARDGDVRVLPSNSEGLGVERRGGDEDSEVMPSLSCIL